MARTIPNRLLWPDIIRSLAIFFVIVVHTSTFPQGMILTPLDYLSVFSFSMVKVCVPLFVMTSGAMLIAKQETYTEFFMKRSMKVIIPWIGWTFFYLVWNYYFHDRVATTIPQWIHLFEVTLLSQYWFIPMIVTLYLLTPLIRKLVVNLTKQDKNYLLLLWFVLVSLVPFIHPTITFPQSSNVGLLPLAIYYGGYYILGDCLTAIKLNSKHRLQSVGLVVGGLIFTLLHAIFLGNVKHATDLSIAYDYFSPGIVLASIGYFNLLRDVANQADKTLNKFIRTLVSVISTFSLGIYIIHFAVMDLLSPIFLQSSILGSYINALIILLVSLLIILVLRKLPLLKHVI